MRRLVEVLGLPPTNMLDQSPAASRDQFFEQIVLGGGGASQQQAGGGVYGGGGRPQAMWKLKEAGRSCCWSGGGR